MEVSGLAFEHVGLTTSLIQRAALIITSLKQRAHTSNEAAHFLGKVELLSETLLIARDLAEQEGTEDAGVQTMVALARQGRNLEVLLKELQARVRIPGSRPLWQHFIQYEASQLFDEIEDNRRLLDSLLDRSELSHSSNVLKHFEQEASSKPSAKDIAEWLHGQDFSDMLLRLVERSLPGTGSWLFEDSTFKRWVEQPGPEGFVADFHHLIEIHNTSIFVTSRPTFANKTALRDFELIEVRAQDSDLEDYVRQRLSQSRLANQPNLHDGILQEAVGIRVGSNYLDKDDLPFIEAVEQVCSGPMFSRPSGSQVALVHYSLNEYLQKSIPAAMSISLGPIDPEAFITKKCLTCLCFNVFSLKIPTEPGELEDRLARYSMLGYAARYWGEHAQRVASPTIMSDIMALFNSSHNNQSAGLVMSTYERHPSHYERAYQGMLGLHIAAYFGLTDVAAHIITDQKALPDAITAGGWTALHWAVRRGWTKMVSILLSYNATPSIRTALDGWNSLHLAAKEGHVHIVQQLIETGVDINAKDVHSRTALYLATWGGHANVVRCLLEALADPRISNAHGATVLHCAAKRGHEIIVSELLSKGININAVDKVGLTALDEAARKQNTKIIERLVEAGAQTRWNAEMWPIDNLIHDLNWDAYMVNEQRTGQVQKGIQCKCHVLEKATKHGSSPSSVMVFRKTFSLSTDIEGLIRKYLESERIILHRLRHPNVVTCFDFDEDLDQNAFLLYMEYCDLGDLKTCHGRPLDTSSDSDWHNDDSDEAEDDEDRHYGFYADDSSSKGETTALDSKSIWSLIAQISLALAYLHHGLAINYREGSWEASFESLWHTVIHRDIKPANTSEAGKGSEYNTTQYVGSRAFWPPEVGRGSSWSTKGDIYSLGATIRELMKLKDSKLETSTKEMINKCTHKFQNRRPSSLEILHEAHDLLKENGLLDVLPYPSRLQIQAVHNLLGDHEGGYILQAFNLVSELLDDIVPFHDQGAKDRRKGILQRLYLLWKDGAEAPFMKYLNDFSLHVLVLLPLSSKTRGEYFPKVIKSTRVNAQWKRSRWTPLHLAVQEGKQDIVAKLLDNGADRDKEDLHNNAPRYYADPLFSELQF
ncbi:nacht ankyrin domain-containing protein [Fusarium circinatum]|uniref:Nacht ankyrin domain-containing protein n=1 Tax=Fusarium circinatum TaxID=48490 RepID=A0A8H5UA73_FUSCI|nr:nacht ankyrin domain-containing protein [Fusarium circinatum]